MPMVRQANGYFARTFNARRAIGIDRATGQASSTVTIITTSSGDLVTMFPGVHESVGETDMSLDITMLDADGSPKQHVSISVDDHYQLMQLVSQTGGSLARLKDYYEDAEFEQAELDDLSEEVEKLLLRCKEEKRLVSFLNGLLKLIVEAKNEQKPLLAIAD
jgi:hypothetical protein